MDSAQTHIIGRLETEWDLPVGKREGEYLSRALISALSEELLPALERRFDRLLTGKEHLRLDHLTIEIEVPRPEVGAVMQQLQDEIISQISNLIEQERSAATFSGKADHGDNITDTLQQTGAQKLLSTDQYVLETLAHILRTGFYPWWWKGENWSELERLLLQLVRSDQLAVRSLFQLAGMERSASRQRFVQQLSKRLQRQLLGAVFGVKGFSRGQAKLERGNQAFSYFFSLVSSTDRITHYFLYRASIGKLPDNETELWTNAISFWRDTLLTGKNTIPTAKWEDRLEATTAAISANSAEAKYMRKALSTVDAGWKEPKASPDQRRMRRLSERMQIRLENYLADLSLTVDERAQIRAWLAGCTLLSATLRKKILGTIPADDQSLRLVVIDQNTPEQEQRKSETRPDKRSFPEEGLYIGNAGLVLLHPYLVHFLRAAGLCRDRKFVSDPAREKAVHLLQYLAAKRLQQPDPDLVLNKVFCGLEPDEPIRRNYRLSRKMKQEADHLLQVVLNYWKALGGTSVDGLRYNYLLREGHLKRISDGWKLVVERKPQDALLKQLPWGFGLIQLPWMNERMYVEW